SISYNLELLSRLAIRINDQCTVNTLINRLISLYHLPSIPGDFKSWEILSTAIVRCFESLELESRTELIPTLLHIPFKPNEQLKRRRHSGSELHKFNNISEYSPAPKRSKALSIKIDIIIRELTSLNLSNVEHHDQIEDLMKALFFLKSWKILTPSHDKKISKYFSSFESWPVIPNHHPWSTLKWLNSESDKQKFVQWILQKKLGRFRVSPSTNENSTIPKSSLQSSAGNGLLENWLYSLELCDWDNEDNETGLNLISTWFDEEWEVISRDISTHPHILTNLRYRLSLIDSILASIKIKTEGSDSLKRHESCINVL
ncbi:hypothetical protein, partial [Pandoraea sputorum]|uniref:hypothetical protein n=1 Tax=Pandoraea sputorum TaxID=93222 RepID=UPI003557CE9B